MKDSPLKRKINAPKQKYPEHDSSARDDDHVSIKYAHVSEKRSDTSVFEQDLRLADVRNRIGFVPQDPALFAGTIRDNVLYGHTQATQVDVVRALQLAHAQEFVAALPDGLDTVVGESGVGLSGGQKQRLAIARALLPKPQILLLDEATSALDARSEEHIRQSIVELKGQCSILVIAHRLSTVRRADRILILDEGRLLASGTHEELIRANELYAHFVHIQFSQDNATDDLTRMTVAEQHR